MAPGVEKRLRYLEQAAILQRIDPNDPDSKLGPGPELRVKFSLLRLRKDDPAEAPLLKMLAGPKPAAELATGPWLAAVFGRGRVLGAWPAADFGDAEIEESCLFLLGACSCQVKRQNPGWDLLMNVNWTEELRTAAEKASDVPSATVASVKQSPPTNTAPEPETVKVTPASEPEIRLHVVRVTDKWFLLGAAVCAVIGLFLFKRRG